mgnify:FL=1
MTSQNVNMMNYISENVAVAGQSDVIERRNFYQVFISLSLLFIPVLALYFFSGMNAQQEYKMQVLRSEVISIAKENATLQLDVAKLEAPARIQNIAETQLGMQVATSAIYGRMETEGRKQKIRD